MTYNDKEFIVHLILYWVIMLAIAIQWIFNWPSDQQLTYFTIGWLIIMCVTGMYRYHIESKD